MVKKGEKYKCLICNKIVEIVEVGSSIPVCCETEMELIEEDIIQKREIDKNVCGLILKCDNCGLKIRILQEGFGTLTHCLNELNIMKSEDVEIGNIYKCDSCNQIIKIQKSGCGPIHCCDDEVCDMDVDEVKEIKLRVLITADAAKDKPFEHNVYLCKNCGREVEVLDKGKGNLICHDTEMEKTTRLKYYFQGGG